MAPLGTEARSARDQAISARRARVAALYEQGRSLSAVAGELDISISTAQKDLVRLGVDRRSLSKSISAARLARSAPLRESRLAAAGACGSPSCQDPGCDVHPGDCHRPGCSERAAIATTTDGPRRVAGCPTVYCSRRCSRLDRQEGRGAKTRRVRIDGEELVSLPEAENRFGVPRWCLRAWVGEGRLAIVPDAQLEKILRLHAQGLSMADIADRIGVEKHVVQRRLDGARRPDLVRAGDVKQLIAEPHVCAGCNEPVAPGRKWHPWCAGNNWDEERRTLFAAFSRERMKRLHFRHETDLLNEGLVPVKMVAELLFWSLPTVRQKMSLERRQFGGWVRFGMNAREVLRAAPNKHQARSRLAKPLAMLNGTERVGAPLALSDAELAIVIELRSADPITWSWRKLADKMNAARAPGEKSVSHMTIKRAFERAPSPAI